LKLSDLARLLEGEVRGDGSLEVVRVSPVDEGRPGSIAFLYDAKYRSRLASCRASVVAVGSDGDAAAAQAVVPAVLVVKDPRVAYARIAALLHPKAVEAPGIHPTAAVDPSATVDPTAHVGAFVAIGPGSSIGARAVIHPHVVIYRDVSVGEDTTLHAGVSVREGCRIGCRVTIHNNAVIGADGFGFAKDASGRYEKIPQFGVVEIGDDVEIGALSAVDRASMDVTRIGRGTKVDNLVQIGHGVEIGDDSIVCAQVGIAGSTTIGSRVILAGQVGVADHVTIGDDVIASAQSGLHGEIPPKARLAGSPAYDARTWLKVSSAIKQLPDLFKRVRLLEARNPGTGPSDTEGEKK
jgi:UDP-3-O-[3-hydroxymyristoyl] glucosamine N-acyltransferase